MRRFQSSSLESPFTYILVLFYRLDSLSAFFQNLFQFLHGSGSLSMAILVWRKSGMPLKTGEAARWRRVCSILRAAECSPANSST